MTFSLEAQLKTLHSYFSIMSISNQRNIVHVCDICKMFLREKYQLDVDNTIINTHINVVIQEIGQTLDEMTLEEANKVIIINVKERLLKLEREQEPEPELEQEQPIADDDDFFKKLQDLETRRTLPLSATTPPYTPSPTPSMPQASGTPSIVYLPNAMTPPRTCKPVVINGGERMWEYFTKRSTLVWNGPIPPSTAQISFVQLLLPVVCGSQTPLVQTEITGAAGTSINVVCMRVTNCGTGWDAWKPCTDAFGELKNLACPWTIKIQNAMGNVLSLGDDGYTITGACRLINKHLKITIDARDDNILTGSTLFIKTQSNKYIHAKVLNYDHNAYAVEILPEFPCTIDELMKARVLNYHAQACIVLSLATSID